MPTTLIRDVVRVLRAPTRTDEYESVVRDWTRATVVAEGRASVQPLGAGEVTIDRQTTTERWRLISDDPALYGIQPTDRILWRGLAMDVDGPVRLWRHGAGRDAVDHHIEATLTLVQG